MTDTTDKPSGELLKFPCDFIIKVFGLASAEFTPAVLAIAKKHVPDLQENALQLRPSKNNKYTAVSLTVHVTSKEQLDSIYQDLTSSPLVLMAL